MPQISLPPVCPDPDKLLDTALETGGETERFDFKELLDLDNEEHKLRLLRSIGAFGNTEEGGFLFIGVSNDRRVVGLPPNVADAYDQTRVHDLARRYLSPAPSLQVRQHQREGKRLVIIDVAPFPDIPSIVCKTATYGGEKLTAGTFLFRNSAAQSAVLTSESDVHALCDAVARRRASLIVEIIQRGMLGKLTASAPESFKAFDCIREKANQEWPLSEKAPPFLEVAFCPEYPLDISPGQLKSLFPGATVSIQYGFPFVSVPGAKVQSPTSWGWYGRIPFAEPGASRKQPDYLWMFSRAGAFIDREHLWENGEKSVIPGGVGIFHIVGRVILLLRFLNNVVSTLSPPPSTRFRVAVAAYNVRGRYLDNERQTFRPPRILLGHASEQQVEAPLEVQVEQIRTASKDVALALLEDIVWQFGRHDLRRCDLEGAIGRAKDYLGPEYRLE
ncbi:MAG: ATP-binding protein [Planctomycetota bacterium]